MEDTYHLYAGGNYTASRMDTDGTLFKFSYHDDNLRAVRDRGACVLWGSDTTPETSPLTSEGIPFVKAANNKSTVMMVKAIDANPAKYMDPPGQVYTGEWLYESVVFGDYNVIL